MVLACIAALWCRDDPDLHSHHEALLGDRHVPFLAIPLFILAGALMAAGGISARLVRLASNLVGHIRGGLGFVVVVSKSSSRVSPARPSQTLPPSDRSFCRRWCGRAIPPRGHRNCGRRHGNGHDDPTLLNMVVLGRVANISIAGLFMADSFQAF